MRDAYCSIYFPQFGRLSLEHVMKTVCGYENPMVPLPQDYGQNFLKGTLKPRLTHFKRPSICNYLLFE